jgi:hypothetical protein
MDAREFFQKIVIPNYNEFVQSPHDVRLLWNAIVSMNTVPEFLAYHRRGYPAHISRNEVFREAETIRADLNGLVQLQICADAFKHVRKNLKGQQGLQATSTGILPDDQATWTIAGYDPAQVLHDAFAALKELSELK